MLNNIAGGVSRMIRNVVINHPNTLECQVFRRSVLRTSDTVSGGMPTIGGLGVLSAEDEHDIEYEHVGNGFALPAEQFSASSLVDRGDATYQSGDERQYLIEPEAIEGDDGFRIKKNDVIYLILGDSVRLALEIVSIQAGVNMSPYPSGYVCNRRAELDLLPEPEEVAP